MLGFDAIGRLALGQITGLSNIVLSASAGSFVVTGNPITLNTSEATSFGGYSVAGVTISEAIKELDAFGTYAVTGSGAGFSVTFSPVAGGVAVSGVPAPFGESWKVSAASYIVTGNAVLDGVTEVAASGSYVVNGTSQLVPSAGGGLLGFGAIGQISQTRATVTSFALNEVAAGSSYALTLAPVTIYTLVRTGDNTEQVYGGVGHYKWERERAKQLAKIMRKTPAPIDRTTKPQFAPIGRPPVALSAPVVDLQDIQNQRMAAEMQAAQMQKKRRREEEAILLLAS